LTGLPVGAVVGSTASQAERRLKQQKRAFVPKLVSAAQRLIVPT